MTAIEGDYHLLNSKYRKVVKQNESLYKLNERLKKALKNANYKILEVKEKLKQQKLSRNEFEMTLPNLSIAMEDLNMTEDYEPPEPHKE